MRFAKMYFHNFGEGN